MAHFSYKSILCYSVSSLCSAVRKFFNTDKRSRVAGHEVQRKFSQSKTPEATTQYIQYEGKWLKKNVYTGVWREVSTESKNAQEKINANLTHTIQQVMSKLASN